MSSSTRRRKSSAATNNAIAVGPASPASAESAYVDGNGGSASTSAPAPTLAVAAVHASPAAVPAADASHADKSVQELSKELFLQEVAAGRARTVWASWRVVNITALDLVACRATIDFYMFLSWEDSAMRGIQRGDPRFKRTAAEYEGLWHPHVEINNAVALEQLLDADSAWNFKDAATGLMSYTQRYRGEIVCESHMSDFPFDFVDVRLNVGPKVMKKDKVMMKRELVTDPNRNIVMRASLPEWSLVPAAPPAVAELTTPTNYTNLTFSFMLERNYGYYLWKVVFIQLMLAMLSWTVPFMGVHSFPERLNTLLTLFLASVAFLYVVNDKIPLVSYLTVLDKITLSSFFLLFIMAVESFVVHLVGSPEHGNDEASARAVDWWAARLFPLAGVSLFAFYILVGLYGGWRRRREAAARGGALRE